MQDTSIIYDSNKEFSFENASVEQTVFENELEGRGIKYFKRESIGARGYKYTNYSFLPEDLNSANEIFENIYKNRTIVPEKKITVITDFILTWFSRIFIISTIILFIFIIIRHFSGK